MVGILMFAPPKLGPVVSVVLAHRVNHGSRLSADATHGQPGRRTLPSQRTRRAAVLQAILSGLSAGMLREAHSPTSSRRSLDPRVLSSRCRRRGDRKTHAMQNECACYQIAGALVAGTRNHLDLLLLAAARSAAISADTKWP